MERLRSLRPYGVKLREQFPLEVVQTNLAVSLYPDTLGTLSPSVKDQMVLILRPWDLLLQ